MDVDVLPKVRVNVTVETEDETVTATAVVDGISRTFRAVGNAPYSTAGTRPVPRIAPELAVARALHVLYHEMMESIHERIDRAYEDI